MEIEIIDEQVDLDLSAFPFEQVITEFLKFKKFHGSEIAVHLVNTQEITRLHAEFFDDPTPTDCITFPIDSPTPLSKPIKDYCHLGEVFICPATAINYCNTHGGSPQKETLLYLIHGLLHLLGYEDENEESKKEMRAQEQIALDLFQNWL